MACGDEAEDVRVTCSVVDDDEEVNSVAEAVVSGGKVSQKGDHACVVLLAAEVRLYPGGTAVVAGLL